MTLYCYLDVFYTHFYVFFFVFFVLVKSFCKKKKFKTGLMTSFILLLKIIRHTEKNKIFIHQTSEAE